MKLKRWETDCFFPPEEREDGAWCKTDDVAILEEKLKKANRACTWTRIVKDLWQPSCRSDLTGITFTYTKYCTLCGGLIEKIEP